MKKNVADVVEEQFQAYNDREADRWASTYSEDAVQLEMDGTVLATGREEIRERIQPRFQEPDLSATLLSRKVYGNVVIDHELITRNFPDGNGTVEMVCVYLVENGLIKRGMFRVFNMRIAESPVPL